MFDSCIITNIGECIVITLAISKGFAIGVLDCSYNFSLFTVGKVFFLYI